MTKILWTFLLSFASFCVVAKETANVLLLNSYHPQYRWTDELTKGVRDTLGVTIKAENLHIEFMDARRFVDDEAYNDKLIALLKHKYQQYAPDVIITSDDHAYYFLIEHGQALFANVPIVFCGVNVFFPDTLEGRSNITGIKEGMEIEGNLELIQTIQPNTKKVIMLGDTTGLGLRMVERAKAIKRQWQTAKTPLILEIWDNFTLEELYQKARNVEPDSAFLMLAIHKDSHGQYFSFEEHLPQLSQHSKVPVYGMWGGLMIGNGVMGGMMNNPYEHGQSAAKIALELLDGKPISDFKVRDKAKYAPFFDHQQLERFAIDQSLLPKSSMVVNRPESIYQQYRRLINFVVALIVFLTAVISILLINIRQRKLAQNKLHEFNQQLESIVHQRTEDLEVRNEALEKASHRMEKLANTDILTGLSNRRAGMNEMAGYIKRYNVVYQHLAVAILDIDWFKKINDSFGHQAGDDVLCALAQTLSAAIRPSDRVYRWGGEEFLIALPDTQMEIALSVCQRIRQSVETMNIEGVGTITVSIGLAHFEQSDSFDAILQRADKGLYQAKEHGRNQVAVIQTEASAYKLSG